MSFIREGTPGPEAPPLLENAPDEDDPVVEAARVEDEVPALQVRCSS